MSLICRQRKLLLGILESFAFHLWTAKHPQTESMLTLHKCRLKWQFVIVAGATLLFGPREVYSFSESCSTEIIRSLRILFWSVVSRVFFCRNWFCAESSVVFDWMGLILPQSCFRFRSQRKKICQVCEPLPADW